MDAQPCDLENDIPDDIDNSLPTLPKSRGHNNLTTIDDPERNVFSTENPLTTIIKETEASAFGFSDDFTLETPHILEDNQNANINSEKVENLKKVKINTLREGQNVERKSDINDFSLDLGIETEKRDIIVQ